jgi:Tetracyclin repressor-like, C-terminal domain
MRIVEVVLAALQSAGFSREDAAHAFWTIDSFVYGHVLQETRILTPPDQGTSGQGAPGGATGTEAEFPHLADMAAHAAEFSVDRAFEFGLDLIVGAMSRGAPEWPIG